MAYGLEAYAPGFPWKAALKSAGFDGQDRFVLREVDALAALAKLFKATPVATWRAAARRKPQVVFR